MKRSDFTPDEQQPALFEMPVETPEVTANGVPLDLHLAIQRAIENKDPLPRLAYLVAEARRAQRAPQEPTVDEREIKTPEPPTATKERKPSLRRGGSFVSGLRRHIDAQPALPADFTPSAYHVALLHPKSIERQLRPQNNNLVYRGLLFTAEEHGRLTFSPRALAQRVGGKVLAHTTQRDASDRHQRAQEVTQEALLKRNDAVTAALNELQYKLRQTSKLENEIPFPQWAHMPATAMDEYIAITYDGYIDMLQAISDNHQLSTAAHNTLMNNFKALLNNGNDIRESMAYWQGLNKVYSGWLQQKINVFEAVQGNIQEKLV